MTPQERRCLIESRGGSRRQRNGKLDEGSDFGINICIANASSASGMFRSGTFGTSMPKILFSVRCKEMKCPLRAESCQPSPAQPAPGFTAFRPSNRPRFGDGSAKSMKRLGRLGFLPPQPSAFSLRNQASDRPHRPQIAPVTAPVGLHVGWSLTRAVAHGLRGRWRWAFY